MNTKLRILTLLTVAGLLCGPSPLAAQVPPPHNAETTYYSANPSGACSLGRQWVNTTTSHFWNCKPGGWVDLTAAGGLSWPLLAPAGAITAPSYAFDSGFADMGMFRSTTTLVLQNRDTTPDALGRSRLSLGAAFLNATSVDDVTDTKTGYFQASDEGGSTMKLRWGATTDTSNESESYMDPQVTFTRVENAGVTTAREDISTSGEDGLLDQTVGTTGIACVGCAMNNRLNSNVGGTQTNQYRAEYSIGASNYAGGAPSSSLVFTMNTVTKTAPYTFTEINASTGEQGRTSVSAGSGDATVTQSAYTGSGFATDTTVTKDGWKLSSPNAKPTCDSTTRGRVYRVEGGAGVADTFEVCAKDTGDAYAWRALW